MRNNFSPIVFNLFQLRVPPRGGAAGWAGAGLPVRRAHEGFNKCLGSELYSFYNIYIPKFSVSIYEFLPS